MEFLAHEWGTERFTDRFKQGRIHYVTQAAGRISSCTVDELCSKVILECFSMPCMHLRVCQSEGLLIKSSDTDVEVIACHLQENNAAEITLSGTRRRARIITVARVCDQLKKDQRKKKINDKASRNHPSPSL